jgi:pimeloyl-ACP methyl ester carboxylesterase
MKGNRVDTTSESAGSLHTVLCGGATGLYRMAYRSWGDSSNPRVLMCVHGLTRNSLDFCHVAHALSSDYRVIAPDVVGRGESDYHPEPMAYNNLTYAADMVTLIARLNVETVDWLGTSMGGLIGMLLAGQPRSPIRRLILNDVGTTLSIEALERIAGYVGHPYEFADLETAQRYARVIFAPFALSTEADWQALFASTFKPLPTGGVRFNYDRLIGQPLKQALLGGAVDLWPIYDRIRCRTLLVRGGNSDLLSVETAQAMTERGPRATLATIDGVGHAPMFMSDDQVAIVRRFLESPDA